MYASKIVFVPLTSTINIKVFHDQPATGKVSNAAIYHLGVCSSRAVVKHLSSTQE